MLVIALDGTFHKTDEMATLELSTKKEVNLQQIYFKRLAHSQESLLNASVIHYQSEMYHIWLTFF